jgi:hypothetical protein
MIVWLASYPRSGNTFVRVLLHELYGLSTYSIYGPADTYGPAANRPLPTMRQMRRAAAVHVVKTHDLPREDHPALYVVRDGRDALVSYAHYLLQTTWRVAPVEHAPRFRETLSRLIEAGAARRTWVKRAAGVAASARHRAASRLGFRTEPLYDFGGWSRHVREWTARRAPTVTIRFEDLVASPAECVGAALKGLDWVPPAQPAARVPSFQDLKSQYPHFFRRGRIGSWRDEMPPDLHDRFWSLHGDAMRAAGYRR